MVQFQSILFVFVSYVCVWMDMCFDSFQHSYTREQGEALSGNKGSDNVGNKVMETVTGAETQVVI